jgi:hypothetical protein
MRYLLILVLLIMCATSALAETGRGWSPWYKLDDGGLNGIEFSHKNDCPPGGTAVCNLQWRFSSGYETPVEIEYTIAWESSGPQKKSERVKIQPGVNVSDAFTVKGSALDEVTVRLISDKKILAEARKEVTAELKRQEDERKRKEEAARKAELARKAEQARQEKLAQAAALPYTPGEAAEVTQFREETARRKEAIRRLERQREEEKRQEERLAEERRQEREREQRAEEERQAQTRRDEEEKKAQTRRDEEREAREWRENREAQEAEDRQSTRDYNASLGAQIMQNINNNAATLDNINRQTTAAVNESNRVRAAQAAERDRARAEKEEREADRRRDAERDRAARADAQRTADARRVQEDARNRQQEQERLQKQARLEEQAQAQEQARQREQERKQEQARKKAEAEKTKLAEQQAEKQVEHGPGSGGSGGSKEPKTRVYRNPGEDARACVTAQSTPNSVTLTNNCGVDIFALTCGDLKYTKKRCGAGPKGGFFTQSNNIKPGESDSTDIEENGSIRWAACKGSISFGNDGEYKDSPNGSYTCLKR